MDDLMSDFIAETRETLEAIGGEIVAWEADPGDRARLDAIFRFVHTVKGSCGFLDLPRLEGLSHAAEDALGAVRDGTRVPDAALVTAVLAMIDRIRLIVDGIETGETVPDADDPALIAALQPGAEPAAAAPAAVSDAPRTVARSIRVPVDLLDRMMASVSDLVLARNELARRLRGGADVAAQGAVERLSLALGELRDTVTRTRMARIDQLFAALPRMVRDLALDLGRDVGLTIDGGDVELDREMIEMVRDPLTHVLRNAIDHGIEPPADRVLAGKPRAGRIAVSARQAGNQILIEVEDDGRGIDLPGLCAKAVKAGIVTAEQVAAMPDARRLALIFEPGLSTKTEVTHVSGRGVGMDVVRANVERIGGLVDLENRPGQGLKLLLRVPLTLTIIPALTLSTAGHMFAVPLSAIEEIVRVGPGAATLERVAGASVATIRGRRLPALSLARVLGEADATEFDLVVVLKLAGGTNFALGVSAVHDHEELVVKPAAPGVMATGLYAGATLPDDNRPMLLLDAAGVAQAGGIAALGATIVQEPEPAEDVPAVAPFPALLFRGLDGTECAVRLSLVERIEDAAADAIGFAAGRLRVSQSDVLLPLFGGPVPAGCERVRLLQMSDGDTTLAYAVASVSDIVEIAAPLAPASSPGPVAGAVRADGRTVELIDGHWLFAEAAQAGAPRARRPLALLADGGTRWSREVLRPLVEQAGYTVAFAGEEGVGQPDVVLAGNDVSLAPPPAAPVVRLRATEHAEGGEESIWRYDRETLAAVLGRHRAAAQGGRR